MREERTDPVERFASLRQPENDDKRSMSQRRASGLTWVNSWWCNSLAQSQSRIKASADLAECQVGNGDIFQLEVELSSALQEIFTDS